MAEQQPEQTKPESKRFLWIRLSLFAAFAAGLVLMFITHHLVFFDYYYPVLIRRVQPGFDEPVSDFLLIKDMLWDDAVEKYPLTVKALIKDGQFQCEFLCQHAFEKEEREASQRQLEAMMQLMKTQLMEMAKAIKEDCDVDVFAKGPQPKPKMKPSEKCCQTLKTVKAILGKPRQSKLKQALRNASYSPIDTASFTQCGDSNE